MDWNILKEIILKMEFQKYISNNILLAKLNKGRYVHYEVINI